MTYFKIVASSSGGRTYFAAVRASDESRARIAHDEHHAGDPILSIEQISRDEYRFQMRRGKRLAPEQDAPS